MRHASGSKGFTLIELLVVIALIGMLATIILVSLNTARAKARDSRRLADIHELQTAIETYYIDHGYLPRNSPGWCTYISNPNNNWGSGFQSDISPKYIPSVPLDPLHANQAGDYFYAIRDNTNGKFTICAIMEVIPGTQDGSLSYCSGWTSAYNYCVTMQ